ncbi:MAG: hypothetical protein HFJ10_06040 [Lachnospiraceae bacterium]|jgi:tetratricopeptide (TPR) repeat protein|nr:hypothetical protein [Lachnospiraceae bacterium]
MGAVLICSQSQAETPYYIESMGIRLYSMEELAYFLYENIYLVDKRMLGEHLWDWIRTEVGNTELAERLKKGMEAGSSMQNMVLTILRNVDYYTQEELAELSAKMKVLNTYQEQERLKLRADEYFINGNYQAAIYEYERILDIRQSGRLGVDFYAHVWNNLGVCYCRLFLFRKASRAFRTSYQYQKDPEVLKEYVYAMRLGLSEEDFEEAMDLQKIRGEQLKELTDEYDRLAEEAGEHLRIEADLPKRLYELEREYYKNTRYV